MQSARVYISLGSNLGNRERMLGVACTLISERAGNKFAASSIYETQPWGYNDDSIFLNQVIGIETILPPLVLLKLLLSIETELGRVRRPDSPGGYQSRIIDIDILTYDDLIIALPDLIVPHPRMHQRMFMLRPLAEVAPEMRHPVLKRSIEELVLECPDQLIVKPLNELLSSV